MPNNFSWCAPIFHIYNRGPIIARIKKRSSVLLCPYCGKSPRVAVSLHQLPPAFWCTLFRLCSLWLQIHTLGVCGIGFQSPRCFSLSWIVVAELTSSRFSSGLHSQSMISDLLIVYDLLFHTLLRSFTGVKVKRNVLTLISWTLGVLLVNQILLTIMKTSFSLNVFSDSTLPIRDTSVRFTAPALSASNVS